MQQVSQIMYSLAIIIYTLRTRQNWLDAPSSIRLQSQYIRTTIILLLCLDQTKQTRAESNQDFSHFFISSKEMHDL